VGVGQTAPLDERGRITTDLYHIDPEFIEYAKTMTITQ